MVRVNVTPRVLILGGTTEARSLAERLAGRADVDVVSSLAGRVARPRRPAGQVRVGGFGGQAEMASWLEAHGIRAVTISRNAAAAAATSHVPLLALRRPPWVPGDGDRWHLAASLEEVAPMLAALGSRHFLTVGRQGVSWFAGVSDAWFLVRSVDPPQEPMPPHRELLLDRGPYSLAGEIALIRAHRIDTVITKNSGGEATAAKLVAARELGLPVVMVQRPEVPGGISAVADVESVEVWLDAQIF